MSYKPYDTHSISTTASGSPVLSHFLQLERDPVDMVLGPGKIPINAGNDSVAADDNQSTYSVNTTSLNVDNTKKSIINSKIATEASDGAAANLSLLNINSFIEPDQHFGILPHSSDHDKHDKCLSSTAASIASSENSDSLGNPPNNFTNTNNVTNNLNNAFPGSGRVAISQNDTLANNLSTISKLNSPAPVNATINSVMYNDWPSRSLSRCSTNSGFSMTATKDGIEGKPLMRKPQLLSSALKVTAYGNDARENSNQSFINDTLSTADSNINATNHNHNNVIVDDNDNDNDSVVSSFSKLSNSTRPLRPTVSNELPSGIDLRSTDKDMSFNDESHLEDLNVERLSDKRYGPEFDETEFIEGVNSAIDNSPIIDYHEYRAHTIGNITPGFNSPERTSPVITVESCRSDSSKSNTNANNGAESHLTTANIRKNNLNFGHHHHHKLFNASSTNPSKILNINESSIRKSNKVTASPLSKDISFSDTSSIFNGNDNTGISNGNSSAANLPALSKVNRSNTNVSNLSVSSSMQNNNSAIFGNQYLAGVNYTPNTSNNNQGQRITSNLPNEPPITLSEKINMLRPNSNNLKRLIPSGTSYLQSFYQPLLKSPNVNNNKASPASVETLSIDSHNNSLSNLNIIFPNSENQNIIVDEDELPHVPRRAVGTLRQLLHLRNNIDSDSLRDASTSPSKHRRISENVTNYEQINGGASESNLNVTAGNDAETTKNGTGGAGNNTTDGGSGSASSNQIFQGPLLNPAFNRLAHMTSLSTVGGMSDFEDDESSLSNYR